MCYLQFKLFVFCGQTIIILNFVFIFTRFPLVSPNLLKCMLCFSSWQLFSLLVTSFFAASSKAKMSCHRGSDTMPTAILYSYIDRKVLECVFNRDTVSITSQIPSAGQHLSRVKSEQKNNEGVKKSAKKVAGKKLAGKIGGRWIFATCHNNSARHGWHFYKWFLTLKNWVFVPFL